VWHCQYRPATSQPVGQNRMRVLLQRVSEAAVSVDGCTVGAIGPGLVLLVGIGRMDDAAVVQRLAEKVASLRIFNDEAGRFNRSLLDVGGGALVVSQFTLYADARKGRRPSFTDAAAPQTAAPLCEVFAAALRQCGVDPVATGVFGAHMHVTIHNDGPVTIWLDSETV
jgi:D-tyrosyl-tRNA(Tyr) deacylase